MYEEAPGFSPSPRAGEVTVTLRCAVLQRWHRRLGGSGAVRGINV